MSLQEEGKNNFNSKILSLYFNENLYTAEFKKIFLLIVLSKFINKYF